MSEIEDLERRNGGSDYENEYSKSPSRIIQQHILRNNEEDDEAGSGGDTSYESLMEDTPSNYNIPNQRYEMDYHEVKNVVEERKGEAKYDDKGEKILPKNKKLKRKRIKQKKNKDTSSRINSERDYLMSIAYGEKPKREGTLKQSLSKLNNTISHKNKSRLTNIANSINGFYREKDHDKYSNRMKESDFARRVPAFKDRNLK